MNGISDPQVRINNDTFKMVPDSVSYISGNGEKEVRVQSSGNGEVETVTTVKVDTKKSSFKCSIMVTPENIDKAEALAKNDGLNFIAASEGTWSKVFNNMTLINDPEVNLSSDGVTELEFAGSPAR